MSKFLLVFTAVIMAIGIVVLSTVLYQNVIPGKLFSKYNEYVYLSICGMYAVPGMMQGELRGGNVECRVLEKDSYSRTIYQFTARNHITDQIEKWIVLCQGYEGQHVYYYEDRCFQHENMTPEDMMCFKETNDWEQPLQPDQMASRKIELTWDWCMSITHPFSLDYLEEQFCSIMNIEEECIQDYLLIDKNEQDWCLYWMPFLRDNKLIDSWLMIKNDGIIKIQEVPNSSEYMIALQQFKEQSGWK